jgi:hypothetical protein
MRFLWFAQQEAFLDMHIEIEKQTLLRFSETFVCVICSSRCDDCAQAEAKKFSQVM